MSNFIQSQGKLTFNRGTGTSIRQDIGDYEWTYATTGSGVVSNDQILATGVWVPLKTSSLEDVQTLWAENATTASVPPSVIALATNSGSFNVISYIRAGFSAQIQWSGSIDLWARSFNSASVLSYQIAPS